MRLYYTLLLAIASMTIIAIQTVEAAPYNTFISISKSKTCQSTNCVSTQSLISYDTSNKKISGDFKLDPKTGDYIRSKGMPNHLNWYNGVMPGKTIIFVEPDNSVMVRSKNIILVPDLREYAPPTNLTKSYVSWNETKRVTYSGVYVDPKCDTALVGVKQNPDLHGIISHLKSECTTDLKNKKETIQTKTKLNYCGQECQHQKFMKSAKELSKQKLIIAGKA